MKGSNERPTSFGFCERSDDMPCVLLSQVLLLLSHLKGCFRRGKIERHTWIQAEILSDKSCWKGNCELLLHAEDRDLTHDHDQLV